MTTNQTADPLAIAVDVVSALNVITVRDAAIIISRVRQQAQDVDLHHVGDVIGVAIDVSPDLACP